MNKTVTDAENVWIPHVILNRYSLDSCSNKKSLFIRMLSDSKIVELLNRGNTKCSYIKDFGIALYFRSLLEQILK